MTSSMPWPVWAVTKTASAIIAPAGWCSGAAGWRFSTWSTARRPSGSKFVGKLEGVSPPILRQAGLRYHGKAIAPGAQTEHRGGAGAVRDLLGGGHAPAALIPLM